MAHQGTNNRFNASMPMLPGYLSNLSHACGMRAWHGLNCAPLLTHSRSTIHSLHLHGAPSAPGPGGTHLVGSHRQGGQPARHGEDILCRGNELAVREVPAHLEAAHCHLYRHFAPLGAVLLCATGSPRLNHLFTWYRTSKLPHVCRRAPVVLNSVCARQITSTELQMTSTERKRALDSHPSADHAPLILHDIPKPSELRPHLAVVILYGN